MTESTRQKLESIKKDLISIKFSSTMIESKGATTDEYEDMTFLEKQKFDHALFLLAEITYRPNSYDDE